MKWMNIIVSTFTDNPKMNCAVLFYDDDDANVHLVLHPTYEEGMYELHKLEKRLGKLAIREVNPDNPHIFNDSLSGLFD